MSRRTSLTVPVIEHSREHRRRRSADDRSNAPIHVPVIPPPRPSSVPGAYPLSSDEDEEDLDKEPSPQAPQIAKARNDATRPRSGSARISRSKLPTTPEHKRPQLQDSASDPGHLSRGRLEVSNDRPIPDRQGHSLPCGRRYKYPNGSRSQLHQLTCKICCPPGNEGDSLRRRESFEGGRKEVVTPQQYADGHYKPENDDEGISVVVEDSDLEEVQKVPDRDPIRTSAQIIHLGLIKEAKLKLTGGEEEGNIYILRDPKRQNLLKIGRSRDPGKRKKQHDQRCGTSMECIFASNRVKNVKRAERLTLIDLKHLRRSWKCNRCSEEHREWFEVEEEIAKEIVRKWIRWINEQDPYPGGQLKPLWSYLMDWGRVPDPELEHQDHIGRWNHWNRVLSPISTVDRANFQAYVAGTLKQNNSGGIQGNRRANSTKEKLSTAPHGSESGSSVRSVASSPHVQFQHAHFYGPAYINQAYEC